MASLFKARLLMSTRILTTRQRGCRHWLPAVAIIIGGYAAAGLHSVWASDSGLTPTCRFSASAIHQSDARDSFVIREFNPPREGIFRGENLTLLDLISLAYGLRLGQVSGGPSWLGVTRFNVYATSDACTSQRLEKNSYREDELTKLQMLQDLLRDRFELRYHLATKPSVVFRLEVASPTFSLPTCQGEGAGIDDTSEEGSAHISQKVGADGGYMFVGHCASMDELSQTLASQVNAPVINATGKAGFFDFSLAYNGVRKQATGLDGSNSGKEPPLVEALEQQLGLRLVRGLGSEKFLLIDKATRPTPN